MNVLNEYFDKIYCINLDRRPDRWSECEDIFNKMDLKVERFSACDGQLINTGYGKVYNGELGGTISHTRMIKHIKDQELDKVLILEDDIEFCNNFEDNFKNAVKDLPDEWDMFFFGGNHTGGCIPISPNIGKVCRTLALHSYGINKKAVDTIYENMIRFIGHTLCCNKQLEPSVAADFYMAKLQPHLNCYSITPNLTWQRESFSDLQQDVMNYEFLK
jgi:GR25 family glycosyltransferase involved in LPS biosynthesis